MERDSYVFHLEYVQHILKLPPEERLYVYEFMSAFASVDGAMVIPEPPEISLATNMILGIITNRMMDDFRKYDEIKAKRAEGGKLGGRPKKPQGLEENLKVIEKPQGNSENLSKAKKPVYVSVSDSVSVSGNECVSDTEQSTHTVIDQVKEFCRNYCNEKGYPVPEDDKMLHYAKYASGDKWKERLAKFMDADEYIRKSAPVKGSLQNFTPSGTNYDDIADEIMYPEISSNK